MRPLVLAAVLAATPLLARAGDDPPAPQVRLPEPAAPVVPPAPSPNGPTVLNADELYAFDSDVECFVAAYPEGFVKVTKEAGPLRVRAKFAGNSNLSTRSFKGPFVYVVEAVQTGDVTLVVTPKGVDRADRILTRQLAPNVGPRPPPPVPPTPTPPQPPTPTPPAPEVTNPFGDLPGLRVLVSFDSANTTRPPGEQTVLYGEAVRAYLEAHCVAGPPDERDAQGNPLKEYRIWPDNTDGRLARPVWRDAFAKRGGKDWILVGNGKAGYSGPLPKTEQEALALLTKFGGQ